MSKLLIEYARSDRVVSVRILHQDASLRRLLMSGKTLTIYTNSDNTFRIRSCQSLQLRSDGLFIHGTSPDIAMEYYNFMTESDALKWINELNKALKVINRGTMKVTYGRYS